MDLSRQIPRRLLGRGIVVDRRFAVDLRGGVVPCWDDLGRGGFGLGVEFRRDVVVWLGCEEDHHVLLEFCCASVGNRFDHGLGLGVLAGDVSA